MQHFNRWGSHRTRSQRIEFSGKDWFPGQQSRRLECRAWTVAPTRGYGGENGQYPTCDADSGTIQLSQKDLSHRHIRACTPAHTLASTHTLIHEHALVSARRHSLAHAACAHARTHAHTNAHPHALRQTHTSYTLSGRSDEKLNSQHRYLALTSSIVMEKAIDVSHG